MKTFLLITAFTFSSSLCTLAQQDIKYKEYELDGNKKFVSCIELSPDGQTLAISTGGGPIFLWDIETKKIIRSIEVADYPWGPTMTYSSDGKYLLLEQQFYTDWRINNDRPNRAEVLDVASGKIILSRSGVHSAALTPDSKSLLTLEGSIVSFWNIATGSEERKFNPPDVLNAIGISSDGNTIAVAQKPTMDDFKNIPSMRDDKKAMKEAIKFREVIKFYDAKTFAYKFMANDIFDIVFSMRLCSDGSHLFLYNAPNTKFRANNSALRNGYIQVVNPENGDVSRTIFSSNAPEPIYKESPDGKYFAATSLEQKFYVLNSVVLFDWETGRPLKNFKNDFRITENTHNGKASFEFLPDHKTMAVGYGYKLALWSYLE